MVCVASWTCVLDGSDNNIASARIILPASQVFDPNFAAAKCGWVARSLPGWGDCNDFFLFLISRVWLDLNRPGERVATSEKNFRKGRRKWSYTVSFTAWARVTILIVEGSYSVMAFEFHQKSLHLRKILQVYAMTYSTRFMRVFSCESAMGVVRPCTARARPRMNDLRTIVDDWIGSWKLKAAITR